MTDERFEQLMKQALKPEIDERDVVIQKNTNNYKYKEIKVISMEKVNWWKKGTSFLKAKFCGKKYGKSF